MESKSQIAASLMPSYEHDGLLERRASDRGRRGNHHVVAALSACVLVVGAVGVRAAKRQRTSLFATTEVERPATTVATGGWTESMSASERWLVSALNRSSFTIKCRPPSRYAFCAYESCVPNDDNLTASCGCMELGVNSNRTAAKEGAYPRYAHTATHRFDVFPLDAATRFFSRVEWTTMSSGMSLFLDVALPSSLSGSDVLTFE